MLGRRVTIKKSEDLELLASPHSSPKKRGSGQNKEDESRIVHLSEAAASSRKKLRDWASLDPEDEKTIMRRTVELEHTEGVSGLLGLASLDIDGDGAVTDAEFAMNQTNLESMVNNTTNLFLNASVIAALILSMVYPIPISGLAPSEAAVAIFGETGVKVVFWVFLIDLYTTIMVSWALLVVSMRFYLILNFWMYSLESKIWFLQNIQIAPIILTQQALLTMLCVSLVIGVTVLISPWHGVVFALIAIVVITSVWYTDSLVSFKAVLKLHSEAGKLTKSSRLSGRATPFVFDPLRVELEKIDPTFGPRYASFFASADITLDLMPSLDRVDYIGLGVSLGHTIRIMEHFRAKAHVV